ncbi:MAG TPA: GNAT family N-acetyltransferase, partial [Arenicellales bacterium]|nr:GNAT family N-acetyltransferase [Arenicellales bacterium]
MHNIRDIDARSIAAIHEMNEGALPHVNSVTREYFRDQIDNDSYFRAVYRDGRPAAFLLAMPETADYDSLNFLWFRERYPRFVYVDRIVVGEDHRRAGFGQALYADLLAWAEGRTPRLACEVNTRPANEPSMRFHR